MIVIFVHFLIVAEWSTQVMKTGREPKQLIHTVSYLA